MSSDYQAYGGAIEDRQFASESYRYGFNGMEKDNEIKGENNAYDFGGRSIYDGRLARFISVDPDENKYPAWSPYCYAANNPIRWVEVEGKGPGDPLTQFKYSETYIDITIEKRWYSYMTELRQAQGLPDLGSKANVLSLWSGLTGEVRGDAVDLRAAVNKAKYTTGAFDNFGKDWARRNLGRYMLGEGGYDIYAYKFLSNNIGFRDLRNDANSSIQSTIDRKTEGLTEGQSITIDFSASVMNGQGTARVGPLGTDYALAVGTDRIMVNGTVTVTMTGGELQYSGTVNYTWWNTYGWKHDGTGSEPHQLYGVLSHPEAVELESLNATQFKERAYFTSEISGNGELIFSEYKDAFNVQGFPEQDDGDSVAGEKVINDFREK